MASRISVVVVSAGIPPRVGPSNPHRTVPTRYPGAAGLPEHPLHPPLTDVTIGMFVLAGGLGVIGYVGVIRDHLRVARNQVRRIAGGKPARLAFSAEPSVMARDPHRPPHRPLAVRAGAAEPRACWRGTLRRWPNARGSRKRWSTAGTPTEFTVAGATAATTTAITTATTTTSARTNKARRCARARTSSLAPSCGT